MKKLTTLGVAMFAVLAFSAIAATSSALALESVWLVNGANPTSEVPVEDKTNGQVVLTDMGVPGGVVCEEVDTTGTVGPGKFDLVNTVTFLKACVAPAKVTNLKEESVANKCTAVDTVTAVNLPWLTEIVLVNGVFVDLILNSGAGAPGYLIEAVCTLGILADDTCTTEKGTANLTNTAENDVLATFPEPAVEEEFANCTIGGKLQGLVNGVDLNFITGSTLAVSEG